MSELDDFNQRVCDLLKQQAPEVHWTGFKQSQDPDVSTLFSQIWKPRDSGSYWYEDVASSRIQMSSLDPEIFASDIIARWRRL